MLHSRLRSRLAFAEPSLDLLALGRLGRGGSDTEERAAGDQGGSAGHEATDARHDSARSLQWLTERTAKRGIRVRVVERPA